jgi:exportin-1
MEPQILEAVIKFRWGALPPEQREGIRNYVSNLIIKLSTDEAVFRAEKVFINKLNLILVEVSLIHCAVANLHAGWLSPTALLSHHVRPRVPWVSTTLPVDRDQILKHDWPAKWTSFIPDIVAASKTSETLCENSMVILKLLSEEVFDFSQGELTQVGDTSLP